jgi:hypothetical protein
VNFSFSRGGRRRPWWRLEFGNGYGEACSAPLEVEEGGRWGRVGQKAKLAGWLLGRLGRKMKKKFFQNKNWIFEFTKALQICTRKFRRNLDTRIFPKFF